MRLWFERLRRLDRQRARSRAPTRSPLASSSGALLSSSPVTLLEQIPLISLSFSYTQTDTHSHAGPTVHCTSFVHSKREPSAYLEFVRVSDLHVLCHLLVSAVEVGQLWAICIVSWWRVTYSVPNEELSSCCCCCCCSTSRAAAIH